MGNFLTENERNDENVIFIQDSKWEGGNMLFMHAMRDKDENIVVCRMTKYVTPNGIFLQ